MPRRLSPEFGRRRPKARRELAGKPLWGSVLSAACGYGTLGVRRIQQSRQLVEGRPAATATTTKAAAGATALTETNFCKD